MKTYSVLDESSQKLPSYEVRQMSAAKRNAPYKINIKNQSILSCEFPDRNSLKQMKNIFKAEKNYPGKFSYEKTFFGKYDSKVIVDCNVCGRELVLWGGDLIRSSHDPKKRCGCKWCNASYPEKDVLYGLEENHIEFEFQKSFTDLMYKQHLYYDFYLVVKNILIEIDGEHHYKSNSYYSNTTQSKRDKIKNDYAMMMGIPILRIPVCPDIREKVLMIAK